MSLAEWAFLIGCLSLAVGGATLGWRVYTWRRARQTQLEVRFGLIPGGDDEVLAVGVEVVNHSDFPVSVQTVQLVFTFDGEPVPLIVGLGRDEGEATLPGTVQPHDSGFIASGIPILPGAEPDWVFANAITAVGNVRTPDYDVNDLPPLPAPMRFSRLFRTRAEAASEES